MSLLAQALAAAADAVEAELDRLLVQSDGPEARLHEAMRYATLGGGKRLRPFLVMETAKLFRVTPTRSLRAAAAVEMLHCYSLAHDDLPAMDDDDMRRGRPSLHKAFDEATAILAGDALLTRAFEILADESTHSDTAVRCELVLALAQAAGWQGMVAGQAWDTMADGTELDMPAVTRLQQLKTGRLIGFSCEAGGMLGKAPSSQRLALKTYAHNLGLAFQIADDLLDAEGEQETVGKRLRKDAAKPTFVSLLGIERARAQADMLVGQAVAALECFDGEAAALREAAHYVVARKL